MELTIEQQIFEQIKKSQKILIVLPQSLTADSVASGLGLKLFLTKMQKEAEVATSGQVPKTLAFLPGVESIQKEIASVKSFVISVDTAVKKLDEVSYQTAGDKVNIYLKSKGPQFSASDLSFSTEKFPVDLVIVLEAKSMENLGSLYESNTDFFFETPKINIDHQAGNEYFGSMNLVDITATSVAEILAELFQKYEEQLLDGDISTCLLTGIIDKTDSFQRVYTTPKAFHKASELVTFGARQQEIVKNIYKTKPLPLLKLWGRALARMRIDEEAKTIHSLLNFTDFEKAEAGKEELLPTLKEFMDNLSGYLVVGLITEPVKGSFSIVVAVHEQISAPKLLQILGEGEILNYVLGNYKIIRLNFPEGSLEDLETHFLQSLNTLLQQKV